MAALARDPPQLDPTNYGWVQDEASNFLVPVMLPDDASPAPDAVLKLIKCGCSSSQPCASARCSCCAAQLSCSIFCACHGNEDCHNECTKQRYAHNDNNDNEIDNC